jgi:hypothetical protein
LAARVIRAAAALLADARELVNDGLSRSDTRHAPSAIAGGSAFSSVPKIATGEGTGRTDAHGFQAMPWFVCRVDMEADAEVRLKEMQPLSSLAKIT